MLTVAMPAGAQLDHRSHRLLDVVLVAWTVVWLVAGVGSAVQIWQLSRLSGSLGRAGEALDTAGSALETIGQLPVVGEGPERLGTAVREAAADIQDNAESSRRNMRMLSISFGLAIIVVPLAPLVALYLPARVLHRRERQAIRRCLESGEDLAVLEAVLAQRAVHTLSFEVLRQVTGSSPDQATGLRRRLANAELTRLGIARRPEGTRLPGDVDGG